MTGGLSLTPPPPPPPVPLGGKIKPVFLSDRRLTLQRLIVDSDHSAYKALWVIIKLDERNPANEGGSSEPLKCRATRVERSHIHFLLCDGAHQSLQNQGIFFDTSNVASATGMPSWQKPDSLRLAWHEAWECIK